MQSSIALLQLSREKNLFLTLQTLKAICTLPKYIVSRFPLDCVGMLQIKDEYLEAGCNFITPEKFLSLDHLSTNENVMLWLVDYNDILPSVVGHWKQNAARNKFQSTCVVVTRSAQGCLSKDPVIAQVSRDTLMINMRTGTQVRLKPTLQVRKLVPSLDSFKFESFTPDGRTLVFQARVHNTLAIVLLDTGATHSFVSASFMAREQISMRPTNDKAIVVDGRELVIKGTARLHLAFGGFQTNHHLRVTQLGCEDVILGMDWLSKYKAVLDCANHTCTLKKGNVKVTLSRKPVINQVSTNPMLTAIQLRKAVKKGCRLFTVEVNTVPLEEEYDNDLSWGSGEDVEGEVVVPSLLKPLIESYKDVFPEDLPRGLPPERPLGHTIPLIDDAKPTFRPLYRLSPSEHDEVRKQITDLLDKGWIQPSSSPFGAPILFVQKKDGSLRMCVDYRALNKQTIKNRYALPRIDDLVDQLSGARYFTSLDLAQGYHQIRVTAEDVPKTAFRTPLGHFEYLVLPFGLTNAPATFQSLMNDVFREHLGHSVLVYLDDILVFSKTASEHVKHVEEVLSLLRKHSLYAKKRKCQFMTNELLYLGHIIGEHGIKPDPAKISSLTDWKTPMNVHDVRSFLGFANYFRKFVQGYSALVTPLTNLTKKDKPFEWTAKCQEAFDGVISNLTNAPVLALADPEKPYEVICDASGWALGAVLIQQERPVAFESRKMTGAELNYTVSEQELLAVVHALKTWRCYLEGCRGLTIVTDHKPNAYLDTREMLSRRQTRWAEFLARFDYKLVYRPERTNVADPLSRLRVCAITRSLARATKEPIASELTGSLPEGSESPRVGFDGDAIATTNLGLSPLGHDKLDDLLDMIKVEYSYDPLCQGGQERQMDKSPSTLTRDSQSGLWYIDGKIYVPNRNQLRERIISECHDTLYSGHFGVAKTKASVARTFVWHGLDRDVKAYVLTCDTCQRSKSSHLRPAGKLMPLPIPPRRWSSISMDFIMELPLTARDHSAILVFVDRLTKMVHLVPTHTEVSAEQTAQLYVDNVFRHHGCQENIVSDRDPRFTGRFWRAVCGQLGTRLNLSTAFHPETDGQTERVNRVLEEFLRAFVTPSQDNWDLLLPMAEFAINNSVHTSTKYTPFFLNSGQHPLNPLTMASQVGHRKSRRVGQTSI